MTTFMSLFSGGGGADIGAMMAGMTPVAAVEYDADIADVYRHNLGDHVTVADICALDPADFPAVDVLHASPPCPNFSTAKRGATETPQDIALSDAVIRFVTTLRPRAFTLENVIGYRKSESYRRILAALHESGYWTAVHKINFADYGVPQTRRRLIVRAVLGGWVPPLQPAHAGRWVGWYEAIEDLIPTLPDCELANWQRERLPDEWGEFAASVRGVALSNASSLDQRAGMEPFITATADNASKGALRAILFGNNANTTSGAPVYIAAAAPAQTVRTATGGRLQRAVLIGGANTSAAQSAPGVGVSSADEPTRLVNASNSGNWRAIADTRIVRMTPRALARFQTFPDWYELPASQTLAGTVIGNAVPPLGYAAMVRGLG